MSEEQDPNSSIANQVEGTAESDPQDATQNQDSTAEPGQPETSEEPLTSVFQVTEALLQQQEENAEPQVGAVNDDPGGVSAVPVEIDQSEAPQEPLSSIYQGTEALQQVEQNASAEQEAGAVDVSPAEVRAKPAEPIQQTQHEAAEESDLSEIFKKVSPKSSADKTPQQVATEEQDLSEVFKKVTPKSSAEKAQPVVIIPQDEKIDTSEPRDKIEESNIQLEFVKDKDKQQSVQKIEPPPQELKTVSVSKVTANASAEPGSQAKPTETRKGKKQSKFARFKHHVWNSEKQELCGRTRKSWGKICLFYLIFYFCLSLFMAACFAGLIATLPLDKPRYSGKDNPIMTIPGMQSIPRATRSSNKIYFSPDDEGSYSSYIDELNRFLEDYPDNDTEIDVPQVCGGSDTYGCTLGRSLFGPCNAGNKFGFPDSKPCILLKVNQAVGWKPCLHKKNPNKELLGDRFSNQSLLVSCETRSPSDDLTFEYYPNEGFNPKCFPYCGTEEAFHKSTVMVQFGKLELDKTYDIWCRFWDSSVKVHHKLDVVAGIRFFLGIESKS